MGIEVE